MKKILILAAIFMLMTVTAVFSAGEAESAREEVELEIFHFKVPWIDSWELLEEDFEAAFPDVTVETEISGGGADWRTLLKTKFAAGEGPDIFIIEGFSDYQLWKEYIEPLSDEPWADNLLSNAREAATFDGELKSMPLAIEGYGYIYNKDHFAAAGIDEKPETLSELAAAASKLKGIGITPFSSGFGTWWVISNHFTNVAFAQQDDPMGFIEGLNNGTAKIPGNPVFAEWKQVFDLVLANSEPNPLTTDHNTQVAMLANGDVGMIQQGNWKEAPLMQANPDLNLGLLPVPISDDASASRIPVGIPFFFVVNSQSSEAEKRAAKDFLNFLVSTPTGQRYVTEDFGAIPAFDNIEVVNPGGVVQDIISYSKEGRTIPWVFSFWPDGAVNEFSDAAQKYVAGRVSFEQYTRELQTIWDRLK
jgi:raffinose/stachyose/melibiose transport system substrate-binding protein